jgi:hypothetical protein
MLNFVLQAASTRVDPTFFDVRVHMHWGIDPAHPKQLCDDAWTQKSISTNLYSYASFIVHDGYIEEFNVV